jgi:predicted N-acetyltransferase YhbS
LNLTASVRRAQRKYIMDTPTLLVRPYNPDADYPGVRALYEDGATFGGQYDDARDSEAKLRNLVAAKPESILVALENERIVGTVTLFEDGRAAWLYRFAVSASHPQAVKALCDEAIAILRKLGHTQVLVYAPEGDQAFIDRYSTLGFTTGNAYLAFWKDI